MGIHTDQWASTQLPVRVKNAVEHCFHTIYDAHVESCLSAVRAEQTRPYTSNTEMLRYYRQNQLKFLREQRLMARQKAYLTLKEKSTNKKVSEGHERDVKAAAIRPAELGDDPRDAEIQVMARIRGYYHLAAGTLTDAIGKKSQYEVFEELRKQLEMALAKGLGIDGNDVDCVENARMLLTESPERERQREELARQQDKLEKALAVLNEVIRI